MTLRTLNNQFDVLATMNTMQSLLPVDPVSLQPNTQIGLNQQSLGKSLIYVQQAYQMVSVGIFPAILIESGRQTYRLIGRALREGELHINVSYFDRWDASSAQIDSINLTNFQDLERCAANLENSDALTFQGTNYAQSMPIMTLSGYKGSLDDTTVRGFEMLRHDLDIIVQILPYSC